MADRLERKAVTAPRARSWPAPIAPPPAPPVPPRCVAHRRRETGVRIPGISAGSGLGPFQWTKDGTALLYSTGRTDEHPGPRLAGRPAQRFTDFTDLTVFRFALSPDGRSILMARGTQSRDAFLLTNS